MNEWIYLGRDGYGNLSEATINEDRVVIRAYCARAHPENSLALSRKEIFALACLLPEIQALIKWAFNVRETMSDADLFVHGEEALRPFEVEE